MIYVPKYYKNFVCIADKCEHNCCVGWEIDIDNASLKAYSKIDGELGEKLNKFISLEGTPHFVLDENDRCPFLDEKGLCEIIYTVGENHLCQICSDHPRFRNYMGNRVEIGLGLCCEAACNLILNQTEPFTFISVDTEDKVDIQNGQNNLLDKRNYIFELIADRNLTLSERISNILNYVGIGELKFGSAQYWVKNLLDFEILSNEWKTLLNTTNCCGFSLDDLNVNNLICENLLNYFVFRHLSAMDYTDYEFKLNLAFCVLSLYIVMYISKFNNNIYEAARMYSSEIEYSDENIPKILDLLENFVI